MYARSRRAPPRCVSGRAASRGIQNSRVSCSRPARAQYADALRPLSLGSHQVPRTVVCASETRAVRAWQAPCRAYGRTVRRRVVRRVSPRTAGAEFVRELSPPARTQYADALRPPSLGSHQVSPIVVCASNARTVRTCQVL
jgi:hypothetical protein